MKNDTRALKKDAEFNIKPIDELSNREKEEDEEWVFSDVAYLCGSTGIITDALKQGFDIAQLPNGDVVVSEIRTVTVRYSWDKQKQKMIKVSKE
jgi:hypothetical protein